MPKLGLPIVFHSRVPNGRQREFFGFVTRVVDEKKETVDLIIFPAHSEYVHHHNIARKSNEVKVHCWEPIGAEGSDLIDLARQVVDLSGKLGTMSDEVEKLKAALAKRAGKQDQSKDLIGA